MTMKLGTQTGSMINHLMSNNDTKPEVGKGCTLLHWTDREAWEVIEVRKNDKEVVIQKYNPKRIDNNGMSDAQEYEYSELTDAKKTLVYKWGSWKERSETIVFEENILQKYRGGQKLFDEYEKRGGKYINNVINTLIPGMTKKKVSYNKVSVLWGVKREYYDYSF
ncbi:MAG: hypothetical protein ACOC1K_03450 [Nanoarchaeota archaeon]